MSAGFCAGVFILLAGATMAQEALLPLGDGRVSAAPQVGSVFSCQTQFGGGGAFRDGEWIQGNIWDPKGKPIVDGAVGWPDAKISLSTVACQRLIQANNLPSHPTGIYPIGAQDDAYQYDRNPNCISAQSIRLALPKDPNMANVPSCLPMGMVGFAVSGAAIFNALDALGRDAPAHEIQDACGGHPERSGQYHYHDLSTCIEDPGAQLGNHSAVLGYALDGFGMFGPAGEDGVWLISDDLDVCHGHAHTIAWDGAAAQMYHYHLTRDYPYTLGCFRGTPIAAAAQPPGGPGGGFGGPGGPRPGGPGGPPPPPRR